MANVTTVVFLSLLLDLFAFTIPLPLFPRIIEWYRVREISDPHGFLARTLRSVSYVRGLFYESSLHSARWDVVLLGGMMGSVFSTLQFLVSPLIGGLSDKFGRRRVLLLTLVGNILSAVVWIQSTSFASYMLSRVIGGLSEGNVQLANAIISDVTPPSQRSKALSSVGIAFAICFCIGPPIGAYFASRPVPSSLDAWGLKLNVYATPAILTLILLLVEFVYLTVALPETRHFAVHKQDSLAKNVKRNDKLVTDVSGQALGERLHRLKAAGRLHFLFMCVFSGIEFTLTFLTFDLFDWSNKQNGMLIAGIGIMSGLMQRGYVRHSMAKIGEDRMAQIGFASCAFGFALLALVPPFSSGHRGFALGLLHLAALFLAMTSATVVTSLTAYTSLQCDQERDPHDRKTREQHAQLATGKALGRFRSLGQGGRGIGPLLTCVSYWTFGPSYTYAFAALAMFVLTIHMRKFLGARQKSK